MRYEAQELPAPVYKNYNSQNAFDEQALRGRDPGGGRSHWHTLNVRPRVAVRRPFGFDSRDDATGSILIRRLMAWLTRAAS